MEIRELAAVITPPDHIRILRDEKEIYIGYLGTLLTRESIYDWQRIGLDGTEEIKQFRCIPDIRHKEWKQRGLMQPLEPDRTPDYRFCDLQMSIYYEMHL